MVAFGKLLRFKTSSGEAFYGEAKDLGNITRETLIGATVPIFQGDEPWASDFVPSDQKETVAEVCNGYSS